MSTNSNPTIDVRAGEEIDTDAIDRALKAKIEGLQGRPVITQFPSGASNLTYSLKYENRD